MPYGDDKAIEELALRSAAQISRNARDMHEQLKSRLKKQYAVPDGYEEMAVAIWLDGKED